MRERVNRRIFLDLCQRGEVSLIAMNRLSCGITRLELIVVLAIALLIACLIPNNIESLLDVLGVAIIVIRSRIFT